MTKPIEEFLSKVRKQIDHWKSLELDDDLKFDGLTESFLDIIDSGYVLAPIDDDGKVLSTISGNLKLRYLEQVPASDGYQDDFIDHIVDMKNYWKEQEGSADKLSGFIFSILVAIDGGTILSPYYLASKKKKKENIAGYLHELLHQRKKAKVI